MACVYRQPLMESDINIEKVFCPMNKIETNSLCSLKGDENNRTGSDNTKEGNSILYFRELLTKNTEQLLNNCSVWEDLNLNIEDEALLLEVQGDIRTTIGQAKLVIKERFNQFKGLVDNCEFQNSEKEVTFQDLQGFWDMVYFQVEDIFRKFMLLEKRKEDNWINLTKPEVTKTKKMTRKFPIHTRTKRAPNQKQIEARKRLAAAKAAIKMSLSPVISFDAVFFKVNSPLRAIQETNATPKEHKRLLSSTPSSKFLHGRFLKKMGTSNDAIKSLNFDKNETEGITTTFDTEGVNTIVAAIETESEVKIHEPNQNKELIVTNNEKENIYKLDLLKENNSDILTQDKALFQNDNSMTEIISGPCNSYDDRGGNVYSPQGSSSLISAQNRGVFNVPEVADGNTSSHNEVLSKTVDHSGQSLDEMIESLGSLSIETSPEKNFKEPLSEVNTFLEKSLMENKTPTIDRIANEVNFSKTNSNQFSEETENPTLAEGSERNRKLRDHIEIVQDKTEAIDTELPDLSNSELPGLDENNAEFCSFIKNKSYIELEIDENDKSIEANEFLELLTDENESKSMTKQTCMENIENASKIKSLNVFTQTIGQDESMAKTCQIEQKLIDGLKQRIAELEKQNEERRIYEESCRGNGIDDMTDFYKSRYYMLVDQVKSYELELSPYRNIKQQIKSCQNDLMERFHLLKTKEKEAEICFQKFTKWEENLKIKSAMDKEELSNLHQLHENDLEEMTRLKEKMLNCDELEKSMEALSSRNESLKNELKKSEERSELIRGDRNQIRENYNDQLRIVENLETTLENERFSMEELKILYQEQEKHKESDKELSNKWDDLIKEILNRNAQLEQEKETNLQDLSEKKQTIQEIGQELASIKHELNITKSNAKLSIMEQQQEVVNSEAKLRDLHYELTRFNQQLQALGPDSTTEDKILPNGYLETPAKSLVVSALRADANHTESPENEASNEIDKPEIGLFSLIGLCAKLMDEVLGSAHQVDSKYKEKTKQLISDKNALMKKVEDLKEKLQKEDDHKNEVVIQLRMRLNEVIEQRDKRSEEIVARETVIKALSMKLQSHEG